MLSAAERGCLSALSLSLTGCPACSAHTAPIPRAGTRTRSCARRCGRTKECTRESTRCRTRPSSRSSNPSPRCASNSPLSFGLPHIFPALPCLALRAVAASVGDELPRGVLPGALVHDQQRRQGSGAFLWLVLTGLLWLSSPAVRACLLAQYQEQEEFGVWVSEECVGILAAAQQRCNQLITNFVHSEAQFLFPAPPKSLMKRAHTPGPFGCAMCAGITASCSACEGCICAACSAFRYQATRFVLSLSRSRCFTCCLRWCLLTTA